MVYALYFNTWMESDSCFIFCSLVLELFLLSFFLLFFQCKSIYVIFPGRVQELSGAMLIVF
jgi:hypothetical protein